MQELKKQSVPSLLTAFLSLVAFISCEKKEDTSFEYSQRKIAFDQDWQFKLNDSFHDSISSKTKWENVQLPHDWGIYKSFKKEHPAGLGGGYLPGGTAWYKKTFQIQPADSSKIISILFDGIYQNSNVWINEHYLDNRPNGYIGFQYNLTPHLNFGQKENTLLVKVKNSPQPNSRWYSGSGIYRHVWLKKTNKLHVKNWGSFIKTPRVSNDSARIVLNTSLINQDSSEKKLLLKTQITYNDQSIVKKTSDTLFLHAGEDRTIGQNFLVKHPELWSIQTPSLYRAVTKVTFNDQLIDQYETTFGIRRFKFDAEEGFQLNGKNLKIKGVCLHHDLGPLGAAVNKRAIERKLKIMKNMGANAVRTAHNPPSPELLQLCDEMGLLVMDEAFDMWNTAKTPHDYSQYFKKWHQRDLTDQILRDRNHPSIIAWSIGNEIPEQWEKNGAKTGNELAKIVKALDPTRPITAGMNPPVHIPEETEVDLQFEKTAAEPNALASSGALDIIGYNYAHQTYKNHHKNFPNKPFIATETNSALATRGYYEFPSDTTKIWPVSWDKTFTGGNADQTVSAFDQVRTPWGALHETTWNIIKKHDFLSGMFIWTGFDYIGEPTPYEWPSRSSYFGVVDLAGFPKDTYYMYQSEWTDQTVLHLFPHWNWKKGQTVDIWAYYNNADEVEAFLNGKSLGIKHKKGDQLHVMWRTTFEPGTLRAVSRKNGQKVKETVVKTAGKPHHLTLETDRKQLKADGKDLSFITVNICDKNGVPCPHSKKDIHFTLEGNGQIVGVASGDPTNHQSFKGKHHKALNGKCLVIVKSKKKAGEVHLSASAEGLKEAIINLTTNK